MADKNRGDDDDGDDDDEKNQISRGPERSQPCDKTQSRRSRRIVVHSVTIDTGLLRRVFLREIVLRHRDFHWIPTLPRQGHGR